MQQHGSSKIILLVLVIITVVIIGWAFYYYQAQYDATPLPTTEGTAAGDQSTAGAAEAEADLQTIDLEGIGAELGDIEKEIAQ